MTAQPNPITADTRNWSTLSHLSAFAVFVGIPSFIGPLVMWLLRKEDAFAEFHAKEALNFNISFIIYAIIAALSIIVLVGLIALPAVLITWFVLVIKGAVRASAGEYYRYPMTMRFVS
ncbi:MAG: DUF4870 domain-containing protein [bacterium]|nr:DUF4870 domain-containing protein [bacterium]